VGRPYSALAKAVYSKICYPMPTTKGKFFLKEGEIYALISRPFCVLSFLGCCPLSLVPLLLGIFLTLFFTNTKGEPVGLVVFDLKVCPKVLSDLILHVSFCKTVALAKPKLSDCKKGEVFLRLMNNFHLGGHNLDSIMTKTNRQGGNLFLRIMITTCVYITATQINKY